VSAGVGPKRVLVMDDSAIVLEAIRDALVALGLEVDTAGDLAEFESRCGERHDLILIDVQMPEVFGDDVAMLLRQKRGVKTKIFFLSSLADDDLQSRAAEAEIDGYISKRRGLDMVVRRVQEILQAPSGTAS
jgi:DNA-binding response OmpR family regulator